MARKLKPWLGPGALRSGWGATVYVVAASLVVSAFTAFGKTVAVEFYATVAQVIPVFLIALIVEATTGLTRLERTIERQQDLERRALEQGERVGGVRERVAADRARLIELGADPANLTTLDDLSEKFIAASDSVAWAAKNVAAGGDQLAELARGVSRMMIGYVVAAAVGEAAALYAVAADTSTTFLLLTSALALVAMAGQFTLVLTVRYRFSRPASEG